MEEVYAWIRNIVIYMILNTIIMNFLGNSSYKKYISMVSGMILVLIVVSPLMKLFDLEDDLDYYIGSNEQAVEASDFKNSLRLMEEQQSEAVFAEYRDRIKKQVELMLLEEEIYLTECRIAFDLDPESIYFGSIIGMEIMADRIEKKDGMNSRIDIEKIEITSNAGSGENEENNHLNPPSPVEISIKIKLSDFYNIEPDNINISIQGG